MRTTRQAIPFRNNGSKNKKCFDKHKIKAKLALII